jgi:multidrug efflux pump subunit AcrB
MTSPTIGWTPDTTADRRIQRKDGANIVDTIQRVRAELPNIRHWMPPSIDMEGVIDRADEIEATLADAQRMFAVTAGLVIALGWCFSATCAPC